MHFIANFRNADLSLFQQAAAIHQKYRLSINPKAVDVDGNIKVAYSSMWSENTLVGELDSFWSTVRTLRARKEQDLQCSATIRKLVHAQ